MITCSRTWGVGEDCSEKKLRYHENHLHNDPDADVGCGSRIQALLINFSLTDSWGRLLKEDVYMLLKPPFVYRHMQGKK